MAVGTAIRALVAGVAARRAIEHSEECEREWEEAREYCGDLRKAGKLGADGYRGMGITYEQCLRGQVSEACGGNPTK